MSYLELNRTVYKTSREILNKLRLLYKPKTHKTDLARDWIPLSQMLFNNIYFLYNSKEVYVENVLPYSGFSHMIRK